MSIYNIGKVNIVKYLLVNTLQHHLDPPSAVIEWTVQRIYMILNTWKGQCSCKINSWTTGTGYGGHTLSSAELALPPPMLDATAITQWILDVTYTQQCWNTCRVYIEKVNIKS